MEISPSDLDLPDHADEDEAAAIAAAISAHLSALESAASEDDGSDRWQGEKWSFAGRLDALFERPRRVRDGAPDDPWTAAGRRDRM